MLFQTRMPGSFERVPNSNRTFLRSIESSLSLTVGSEAMFQRQWRSLKAAIGVLGLSLATLDYANDTRTLHSRLWLQDSH